MKQSTPLQDAIIAGSIMGSIFSEYNPNDTNKNMKVIRANIKKMMCSRSRKKRKRVYTSY